MIKRKIFLMLMTVLILIDQLVKVFFFNIPNSKIVIIKNFFSINVVKNYGIAWSALSNKLVLIILLSIISLYIIYLVKKSIVSTTKLSDFFFVLIFAGAIGNLIDRLFRGFVIDYLDFIIFNYDFPIFNIADMYLVIGFIALFIYIIIKEKNE